MATVFQTIAQEHGSTFANYYNQNIGLKRNWRQIGPESQAGVCAGLVIVWLAASKMGLVAQAMGARYPLALYQYAELIAQHGANNAMGEEGINSAATVVSLRSTAPRWPVNNGDAIKKICNGPSDLVLLNVTGHAVGVAIKKPKISIFDPNLGAADFPTSLKFATFMPEFLRQFNYQLQWLQFFT